MIKSKYGLITDVQYENILLVKKVLYMINTTMYCTF